MALSSLVKLNLDLLLTIKVSSVIMLERVRDVCRRLWASWLSVQVELHGCYSVERLRRPNTYSSKLTTIRLLHVAVCLLTPLPSLAVSLLKEIPPLAPPDAGPYENWVFVFRSWAVTSYIGGSVLVHLNQCIPRLQLSVLQIVFVGAFAAAVSNTVVFAISVSTVFPLPFGLLLFGPPDIAVIAACFAYIVGPRWRTDPSLWREVKQQLDVLNCQVPLTFIYPIYIFGFVSLTGISQVAFIVVLPIVRLIAKNRISRTLNTHDDMKLEAIIVTVEVFHALYISNALQIATSWTLTAVVMIMDLAQLWLSMLDVMVVFNEVKVLMARIPREHPLANEDFLQVAMRILAVDGTWRETRHQKGANGGVNAGESSTRCSALMSEKGIDIGRDPIYTDSVRVSSSRYVKGALFQGAQVVPVFTPDNYHQRPSKPDPQSVAEDKVKPAIDITTIFSLADRALFVDKVPACYSLRSTLC